MRKKKKETWSESVVYIILGLIIAVGFNFFLGVALQTDTPVVAVLSNSMEPTLNIGDMVIVSGDKNVLIGDIIVFDVSIKDEPIIHRVYNITSDGILTKGDNVQHVDSWVIKEEDLHGKAILKVPLLGWLRVILNNIQVFIFKR